MTGHFNDRPAADADERAEWWHYVLAVCIAFAGVAIMAVAHWRLS